MTEPPISGADAHPVVLLMLKAPVEGQVKTRLAKEIGVRAATAAYRALVEHQLRGIPSGWPRRVCCAPADAEGAMRAWLGDELEYGAQAEGDLGQRLTAAVRAHFSEPGAGALLVVGGDCPYLRPAQFAQARDALKTHEVVLVPAEDGGYCLIGLSGAHVAVFASITWSTASVLAETRARLREAGLRWCELETLEDVDDLPSWRRAIAAFPELGVE